MTRKSIDMTVEYFTNVLRILIEKEVDFNFYLKGVENTNRAQAAIYSEKDPFSSL